MKFLFIVDDFLPKSTRIAGKMIFELASEMKNNGHSITVLHPDSEQTKQLLNTEYKGLNIFSFRSGKIKNVNKIKRALNEMLLSYHAWLNFRLTENYTFDGVIFYSPTIFFGPFVYWLKKKYSCKTYLILRDIFPQWAVDHGLISTYNPALMIFRFFEKLNYKAADMIAVESVGNLNYINKFKTKINTTQILFNWTTIASQIKKNTNFREKLNLQNKVVFFYGGNLAHEHDIPSLMRLCVSLKEDTKAHFLFVGEGYSVDVLHSYVENFNLKNVTYLKSVDQDTYSQMLLEFDVGIFSLAKNLKTAYFPGKLLGYMNANLPILGCVNSNTDIISIVEHNSAGFICMNGDDDCILRQAKRLIYDDNLRITMGQNSNSLLKRYFSVNEASKKILTYFENT